ncbi:hypothetical protein P3X46_026365 [Hevea brasiliensis]|uniref:Cytochrome P450 n=1 Tax=Hevea brasiliensis TaxID=3981 RepID=A0ABQ9KWE1_HEVBR|nr:alkane hydroxylase MAH1-like [Hevea brasiliensis]KAJ9152852.1 hypothetical protein P3X46_026365 [Hevea brasiliensis]
MAIAECLQILAVFIFMLLLSHWIWNNEISPVTNWPVVGMLPGLLYKAPHIHQYATQLLKQSGGTFEFRGPWFANMNILLTCDPINIRHISTRNFLNYQKGPDYKKIFEPFGDGVLNSDFESWKSFRRMIQSMIKDNKFQLFLERSMREKVTKGLIPVLQHVSRLGIAVDLQDLFQRFTFDNICLLVLGFDPNSLSVDLPEVAYKTAFDDVEEAVFYRHIVPESIWKLQKWLNIGQEKKLSMAMSIIDNFLEQCISSKKEEVRRRNKAQKLQVQEKEEEDYDLITACIEEEEMDDEETKSSKNSDKYLRDIGFNFIAAGKDTVNAALTWFFWLIATHPSVEEKIIEEIKAKLQRNEDGTWRFYNLQELSKLVYIHGAICETLRLYPAVPFNHRVSVQEDTLPSGHHVEANTRVMFSLYSMGSMEEIWGDDCLEFKPERWISERGSIIHVPSYKFIAFNTGPRSCLGKDITFIQMKIIATSILWNYHVKLVEDHPVAPCLSVMMHMKHGLKVRISKRGES